ncbi:MAG: hypothetical protein NUV73_00330, partial [Candidatus Daviesbacteria bacterium]|nr:hypothetical protein [Candidatus Daviesbacteria bacterium]
GMPEELRQYALAGRRFTTKKLNKKFDTKRFNEQRPGGEGVGLGRVRRTIMEWGGEWDIERHTQDSGVTIRITVPVNQFPSAGKRS